MVRKMTSVLDLIHMVSSYFILLKIIYGIDFKFARISCVVIDTCNNALLSGLAPSSYRRYVHLAQFLFPKTLDWLRNFVINESTNSAYAAGRGRSNITYFTDKTLLDADEDDMLLMLKSADVWYTPDQRMKFHASPFSIACKLFIEETRSYFTAFRNVLVCLMRMPASCSKVFANLGQWKSARNNTSSTPWSYSRIPTVIKAVKAVKKWSLPSPVWILPSNKKYKI